MHAAPASVAAVLRCIWDACPSAAACVMVKGAGGLTLPRLIRRQHDTAGRNCLQLGDCTQHNGESLLTLLCLSCKACVPDKAMGAAAAWQMSPYLVLETDDDKQKTDVADDAGESAAWTSPIRLSGSGPIKVSAHTAYFQPLSSVLPVLSPPRASCLHARLFSIALHTSNPMAA